MKGMIMNSEVIIEQIEKILAQIDDLNAAMQRLIGK
jgi:hypothetical protein